MRLRSTCSVGQWHTKNTHTTLLLGSVLRGRIRLDAVHKIVTALRVADVLNAHVNALLHLAVANGLVDDNTDCESA